MAEAGSGHQFRGFLSHSAADAPAARRLQRRLEAFVVPRLMRGASGPNLGKFLFGQTETSGVAPQTVALQEQLSMAEWLIVCCSPAAAASATVESEIAAFLSISSRDKLLAVLFEGEPRNALPPLLRAGDLFGVDFRPSGDGEDLGVARLAARMLGVEFADLRDQTFAETRMRMRNRTLAVGALGAFALAVSIAGVKNVFDKHSALLMAERSVDLGADVLAKAEALASEGRLPVERRKAIIDTARERYEHVFAEAPKTDEIKSRRAALLVRFADLYQSVGDAEQQGAEAAAALAIYDGLPGARQAGLDYVRALAAVGSADLAAGRAEDAVAHLTRAADAARPLTQDPEQGPRARAILAECLRTLGEVHVNAGKPEEALPLLTEAAPLLAANAEAAPKDEAAIERLAVTLDELAEAQLAAGDRAAAKATLVDSVVRARAWLALAPDNAAAKSQLAFALLKLGAALADENDARGARTPLTEAIPMMRELVAASPRETRYRSALTLLLWTDANVLINLRQNGDDLMDEAIGLVREDVARAGNDHTKDQLARMLAVRAARSNQEAARDLRVEIVQLRRSIRAHAPDTAVPPTSDLAGALEQLGDAHAALRESDDALGAYREAVVWRRRALTADPHNVEADVALSTMLLKYGEARLRDNDKPGAIRSISEAARRRRAMADAAPADADVALAAVNTLQQLASLQLPTDRPGARDSLEQAVGLLERLSGDHPEDPRYRNNLRRAQQRLAALEPPTQ